MAGLDSFMYGAVGGGLVATTLRVLEQYWVNTWFTSSAEARRKLVLYGRPLYFNCHQMAFRFTHISQQQQEHRPESIKSLQESPADANSKRSGLRWLSQPRPFFGTTTLTGSVNCWLKMVMIDQCHFPRLLVSC
jgi:hypothetical protein